ncbi:hypothetical protein M422DRAFT_163688 [Sphaerobolus stellatus SS14]|nr:hypothetical protein M422DRAFT_163688 [Sphaerobolus stellatus SS14]
MGQAIASLREMISAGDKAAKKDVLEQVAFLVNTANSKLDKYEGDLDANKESVQKKMIPGYRALRWERGYRVGVENRLLGARLVKLSTPFLAVETRRRTTATLFCLDSRSTSMKYESLLQEKLIQGSLDAIANAGEQEEQKFFVFDHHNAIIRIDTKIWRYNFNGKGVMADSENVFCYIFCTSVVDHNALQIDELTYLLSEHAGDEKVEAYVDKLISVWTKIRSIAAVTDNFQQKTCAVWASHTARGEPSGCQGLLAGLLAQLCN